MNFVKQYYDDHADIEWERQTRHPMEFAITHRALAEFLPQPPCEILDVGGGPGRYAIELAGRGYRVTLFDLSARSLAIAQEKAREANVSPVGYVQGDATDLSQFPDRGFDAVLLLGPLYHLIESDARRQAVLEAARVLKPGGIMMASVITRYALLRYAAKADPEWIRQDPGRTQRLLETGVPATTPDPGIFTLAYFAHPSELAPLMESGGFRTTAILACEGIVSQIGEALPQAGAELWQNWVDLNYQLARDPSIHGAADHLLYVGTHP